MRGDAMQEASYYLKLKETRTECYLCPHRCIIAEGRRGICGVRKNVNGVLFSEVYGFPVAVNTDPVEKKPLYHFYPGSQVLSFGTVGCNMNCFYCQNCDISQETLDSYGKVRKVSVEEMVSLAGINDDNLGVAFTYNEPTIYFEYMYDIAGEIHERGLKNVVVTNGYISDEPLKDLLRYADAFNVDLKAFDDQFYRIHTKSRLQPVLNAIETIAGSGVHLEITNLIIPNLNDSPEDFRKMVQWIADITGSDTPLHLSRYFPRYKANEPVTPLTVLKDFRNIARERLNYVYLGNVQDPLSANTYCKNCHELVIERLGYHTSTQGLEKDGRCTHCGTQIIRHM